MTVKVKAVVSGVSRLMKDSSVEWLGTIPDSWDVVKLGFLYSFSSGDTLTSQEFIEDGAYEVYGANGPRGRYDKFNLSGKHILVGRVGALCGNIHLVDGSIWVTEHALISSKLSIAIDDEYSAFLFTAMNLGQYASGTAQPVIAAERIRKLRIPLPSLIEQNKIANFLAPECARIDSVIEKTCESIEEYKKLKQSIITEAVTKGIRPNRKMKKNGIAWIGTMPDDWKIRKGKWILTKLERPVLDTDSIITCFRDGEVTLRSKRREEGFTFSLQEIGYQGIESGDLVIHVMDGFAGAIGISDSRGKGTPVLNVLDTSQNKRYLMYYLRSMAYNGVFLSLATGIRIRSCDTNWNKLKELPYPVPSLNEQQEIADYIDEQIEKIDNLIAKKTTYLTELDSYKKSIIYEYVTGKKEVPV